MSRICTLILLLMLCACGGGGGTAFDIGPGGSNPDLSDVMVYLLSSPYAKDLKACAIAANEASLCSLETLPLIGQDVAAPSKADIMDRVLVSHSWMAVRFEEILNLLPADILSLFKGVTAIVIDSDIRPSFYSPGTAAIYIDPAFLWLSNAEKATISKAADFRTDFGADLQFFDLWRYVKNNDYAYAYYPLNDLQTRQLSDILYPMARLLYHELAHANDFLPPASLALLDPQLSPYAATLAMESDSVSAHLNTAAPLTSLLWRSLAKVLYRGDLATAEQIGFTAAFVGSDFASDVANETYSYSSIYEDTAMLFEETMMKYHFDIDRDIAFSDVPATSQYVCDDLIVRWGVRNRIGATTVKPRAALVAAELLPEDDLTTFFAALAVPTPMANNVGWCSNLNLGGVAPLRLFPVQRLHPGQLVQDRLPPE